MNAKPSPSTLGARLKAARNAKGLSLRALADKVGVDNSFISKIESGAKSGMTDDKAKKLAKALDLTVAALIDGEGEAAPASAAANAVRDQSAPEGGPVQLVMHGDLIASPLNPRKRFDDEKLAELAGNIASQGLLQNLVARPHSKKPGKFELAAGERRYRALGLLIADGRWPADRPIPVQVRDMDDRAMLYLGMAENVQRDNMHPLEEGAGFAALVARSDDPAEATRQLAGAFGKTPRWVQLRIALDTRLAEPVKAAFLANKIGLEEARAFTLGDQKTQAAFFKSHGNFDNLDADWIRGAMAETLIPVTAANFPEADYKGEILDDGGERYFADIPQFLELQSAAIERTIEKLKKKWAWVERVDGHVSIHNYGKSKDPKKAGAIIEVSRRHVVSVLVGLVKPRAKPAARASGKGAAAEEEPAVELWTKTHLAEAKRRKSAALQSAILAGGAVVAMRVACLALLGGGHRVVKIKGELHDREDKVLAQPLRAELDRLGPMLGMNAPAGHGGYSGNPFDNHVSYDDDQERADLWSRLAALSEADVGRLFAALVAARTGSLNGQIDPRLEDDRGAAAIAASLGVACGTMPEGEGRFLPDEEFLKSYRKPGLIAAALASGTYAEGSKLADLAAGKIRAAMIASTTIDPDWLPDELRFQTAEAGESEAGDDEEGDEEPESDEEARP